MMVEITQTLGGSFPFVTMNLVSGNQLNPPSPTGPSSPHVLFIHIMTIYYAVTGARGWVLFGVKIYRKAITEKIPFGFPYSLYLNGNKTATHLSKLNKAVT